MIASFWQGMQRPARIGFVAGLVVIASAVVLIAVWAFRIDYQVLFADIAQRDAAAMTAELDKMKLPYRFADDGHTILVPKDQVYKTRMALMRKELPLHGGVGFEVFNNADFGMTEFVQKVNYQRAVQGELTRTIQSIDNVQAARVHLAVPEQGLFKKSGTRPKASVTVTMAAETALAREQVAGIQRLVAAAVPDMAPGDVTVLDQHGSVLAAGGASTEGEAVGGSGQLDAKRATEEYLTRKLMRVLERTFGAGMAVASVDVVLNLDQSKVTTEEMLPARGQAGIAVRERYTAREPEGSGKAPSDNRLSSETDYLVGKRVEQLAVASGTVRRMTVAVLVQSALDEAQLEQLRQVVSVTAGVNAQRGDAIVLYPIDRFVHSSMAAVPAAPAAATAPAGPATSVSASPIAGALLVGVLALLAAFCGAVFWWWRRSHYSLRQLNIREQEQLLHDIQGWLGVNSSIGHKVDL